MSQGLKDRELQEYYEALFGMYTHPGWQKLMEDVEQYLEDLDTPRDVTTVEQLHHRRGELARLDWLKNHQVLSEHAYAHLLKEDGQDASNVESTGVAKVIDANVKDE